MTRFKELVREPALLIDLAETLVLLVVAFGLGLSGDQQTYIVAAVVAALGLAKAFMTRPFVVAALTDFGRAALVLLASFGVGLTADQIAMSVTALGLITTVIIRGQITPTTSPAGAGPVHRGESGHAATRLSIGVVLALTLIVFFVAVAASILTHLIGA